MLYLAALPQLNKPNNSTEGTKTRSWELRIRKDGGKEMRWTERERKRKRERETLLPVCDSRLGDSRPGRPGCSSLGLSWIPAPEQRFGGRPGRELEGERQTERLITMTQKWIHSVEYRETNGSWSFTVVTYSLNPCDTYPQSHKNRCTDLDSKLITMQFSLNLTVYKSKYLFSSN